MIFPILFFLCVGYTRYPFLFPIIPPPNLSNFDPTTFSEIRNLIFSSQNKQCELDSIPTFLLKLCFDELGPTIINIIIFLYLKASFHLHSNKQSFILYSKNLLFLMMISTTFVLFPIWTLFPKFSRKLLPLVSSLTYCLIPCLLHSNLPIACSIPLKPHFSVFTMTSS